MKFESATRDLLGPFIVAVTGIVMLVWSWGTWPDPIIDFGREIYVPWRLCEGEVLYRDIVSYFNGPLSTYTHALLFKVFGVSLRTLVIFNLVLIAALVSMLYWLITQIAGRLAAAAAGVSFFVMFAFAQFVSIGNYNYVCPYSYELTHGITLTAGAIMLMVLWTRRKSGVWLAAAGAVLGLIFLTKAEIFLAAGVALGAGLAAILFAQRASLRRSLGLLLTFTGPAFVAPLLALALLSLAMSPADALRGLLGAWRWIGDSRLTALPYFRELAGTADIPASLRTIAIWTGGYAALLVVPVAAGLLFRQAAYRWVATGILFGQTLAIGFWKWQSINWNNFIRPVPLLLVMAVVVLAILLMRRRDIAFVPPLIMATWALALLAKMPLKAHIHHYGFALAMPAALVLLALLFSWIPRILERRNIDGWPVRATIAAALLVALYARARGLETFFDAKTYEIGSGADRFRTDKRAVAVGPLLEELSVRCGPDDTLMMMPEGLLVNYLARRVNPTGQLNFTPPAVIMYGEEQMLAAMQARPPDWIVVLNIDTGEYGARSFGNDYAQKLARWIAEEYLVVQSHRLHPVMRLLVHRNRLRR